MNNVTLVGRLTAQPELKTTPTGTELVNFTIADNKSKDKCYFIDCVAFKNTAQFISKYFNKGSWIGITGEIQTRTYKDKDEKSHKVTEIFVTKVDFVGAKEEATQEQKANIGHEEATIEYEETDLPF